MAKKQKNKNWFQVKGYLHFSPRLKDKDYNFVKNYIELNDEYGIHSNIAKHSFYPLIHRTVIQRRYKKIKDNNGNDIKTTTGKIKRSHFDFIENKSNAKPREIFFANHLDAQIYSYFAKEVLGKNYEDLLIAPENKGLADCITAYRFIPSFKASKKGKSNIHFAKEVFDFIAEQKSCTALAFDIEKFFDSLNHSYLKKAWAKLLKLDRLPSDHFNIFKSITNFSFVNEKDLIDEIGFSKINDNLLLRRLIEKTGISSFCNCPKEFREKIAGTKNLKGKSLIIKEPSKTIETQRHFWSKTGERQGIAQGTALSAFLANLYLLEFDQIIFDEVKRCGGLYRRYSDDIVIVCPTEKSQDLQDWVFTAICEFGLRIQPIKTEISVFKPDVHGNLSTDNNFKYLGFEFDGKSVRLKKPCLAKYYRRMKKVIRIKSIKASIKKSKEDTPQYLHKNKIIKSYSHFGCRNFITYANRANNILKDNSIAKQIRRHTKIMNLQMQKYEIKYDLDK